MQRNQEKIKGVVISNKMEKTVIIETEGLKAHKAYKKPVKTRQKYYAHTVEKLDIGEEVVIESCRPLSKLKRYRVTSRSTEQNAKNSLKKKRRDDTAGN